MKGDFAKTVFDPVRKFVRVLLQQGRVTLDADATDTSGGGNRPAAAAPAATESAGHNAKIRKPD
jgi:uncharacterized protein DUF6519